MAGAGEWQTAVEGLVREEEVRFAAVPAGGAAYGTAGFRDRSAGLTVNMNGAKYWDNNW